MDSALTAAHPRRPRRTVRMLVPPTLEPRREPPANAAAPAPRPRAVVPQHTVSLKEDGTRVIARRRIAPRAAPPPLPSPSLVTRMIPLPSAQAAVAGVVLPAELSDDDDNDSLAPPRAAAPPPSPAAATLPARLCGLTAPSSPLRSPRSPASPPRTYFHVPFADKEAAKAVGAHWDPQRKLWYAPDAAVAESLLGERFVAC